MSSERLRPLLDQLTTSWEMIGERMEGVGDEEFRWEPAPGAFTVRLRDGRWVPDQERGPNTGSLRTIAWLAGHLGESCALRADYTVGEHRLTPADFDWPGTAEEGLAFMSEGIERWLRGLGQLSDKDALEVGRSSMPWGLDPNLPLIDIVWWQNREIIHHGAEMATLRDLYGKLAAPVG